MGVEGASAGAIGPTSPMAPGPLLTLADAGLEVDVAPQAGGRIAQVRVDGTEQLVGYGDHDATAAIAWGSYPMVPWCGRIREGRFQFDGRDYALPVNLGPHAIHGVGFLLPWQVVSQDRREVELELRLPRDGRWPFGGTARQRIGVDGRRLVMELSVTASDGPMPVTLGWHPWFRKPDRLEFAPEAMYPRDADGMTLLPAGPVGPSPWDDCFVNRRPVAMQRDGRRIVVESACTDWVVYDQPSFATCVEPQTGPPDAFNLDPSCRLEAGQTRSATCTVRFD